MRHTMYRFVPPFVIWLHGSLTDIPALISQSRCRNDIAHVFFHSAVGLMRCWPRMTSLIAIPRTPAACSNNELSAATAFEARHTIYIYIIIVMRHTGRWRTSHAYVRLYIAYARFDYSASPASGLEKIKLVHVIKLGLQRRCHSGISRWRAYALQLNCDVFICDSAASVRTCIDHTATCSRRHRKGIVLVNGAFIADFITDDGLRNTQTQYLVWSLVNK